MYFVISSRIWSLSNQSDSQAGWMPLLNGAGSVCKGSYEKNFSPTTSKKEHYLLLTNIDVLNWKFVDNCHLQNDLK